jgi:hypothetical protein
VSHEPRIQELFDDFRRLGHHPFPLPLGILLDEAEGKALHSSACVKWTPLSRPFFDRNKLISGGV